MSARTQHARAGGPLLAIAVTLLCTVAFTPPSSGAGAGSETGRNAWQPPVAPLQTIRGFEPPAADWAPGHRGVDLAAAPGQPVHAPADGVIAFAGRVAGKPVVTIDHGAGLRTTFEPVTAVFDTGRRVSRGTVIGRLAPTAEAGGHCAGRCLHWGARIHDTYVDPLRLLRRIVLKPTRTAAQVSSPGPASTAAAAAPQRHATAMPGSR